MEEEAPRKVLIYTATSPAAAEQVCDFLAKKGLQPQFLQSGPPSTVLSVFGLYRLRIGVNEDEAEAAKEALEEHIALTAGPAEVHARAFRRQALTAILVFGGILVPLHLLLLEYSSGLNCEPLELS